MAAQKTCSQNVQGHRKKVHLIIQYPHFLIYKLGLLKLSIQIPIRIFQYCSRTMVMQITKAHDDSIGFIPMGFLDHHVYTCDLIELIIIRL